MSTNRTTQTAGTPSTPTTWTGIVELRLDVDRLREQRNWLLDRLDQVEADDETTPIHADGLVNLLDFLLDVAEDAPRADYRGPGLDLLLAAVRRHPDRIFGSVFQRSDFPGSYVPDTFAAGSAEDILNERGNGLVDDETPFALALLSGHGYVFPLWATFHPQAWQNDYAIDVDPQGPTRWQITTDHLLSIIDRHHRDVPDALKETITADTYCSDALRYDAAAPAWVHEWSGPFYISVEDSTGSLIELLTEPRG